MPSNLKHNHPWMSTLTWWHASLTRFLRRYMGCVKWTSYVKAFESYITTACKCMHLVRCGHFPSLDKDSGHIIGSAILKNPMLHTNLMVLSFIELELWVIKVNVAGIGIFNLWPWPDDLHIQAWRIVPVDTLDVQIWTSYVKAVESYYLTDIQTNR